MAGERGVVLGHQDGTFEAWVLPVKLLSHFAIQANVEAYSVPIDVNQQAAEVEVRPDRTTITYSHPAFTVRQIMFSPDEPSAGTGPLALFEFDCLHPTDFTFSFPRLWSKGERISARRASLRSGLSLKRNCCGPIFAGKTLSRLLA